jgi:integrase/recombinase XerD
MKNDILELPRMTQRFFCEYLGQQRDCSQQTIHSYRDTLRLLLQFLSDQLRRPPERLQLADLDADNVLRFLDYLQRARGNTVRTRNQRLACIRCFLRYVGRHVPEALGLTQRCMAIPRKKQDRRLIEYLSQAEVSSVLGALVDSTWSGQRDHVLFATMYNTGARVSEIASAKVGDFVDRRPASLLLHGKGSKERMVPLWRKTAGQIRVWIRRNQLPADGPLFPNGSGDRLTRSGIEKRLADAARRARVQNPDLRDKRVSPHVLRHSTAMHLLQSGVDLSVIALWMGHESMNTTHLYVTSDMKMKEEALDRLQAPSTRKTRYRPSDKLLAFLENL